MGKIVDKNEDSDVTKEPSKKKKKSKKSVSSEPEAEAESSSETPESNEDSLETLKSKYEMNRKELDSLHSTKSQFIWLLKQVITAENKTKEDKEKKRKN